MTSADLSPRLIYAALVGMRRAAIFGHDGVGVVQANQSFTFIGDHVQRGFSKHTPAKHPNSDNQHQP